MEKTKIRRSLFIGLGGTGMRTLLILKKLFTETYGEVPPMIGFLGVDTDEGEYTNELPLDGNDTMGVFSSENTRVFVEGKHRPTTVILEPIEQMRIVVEQPKDIYYARKKHFYWLPNKNLMALKTLKKGAGQVRSNGRFAIVANSKEVQNKIQDRLNEVANVEIVDNPKYELLDANTDIYMIFSLGGGTGCGSFIDMAYLVRRISPSSKLAAYAVLPNVFRAQFMNEMERVRPNAYGAILDLNWLMCTDWNSTGIKLPLQDGLSWTSQDSPFDACIFIDNENRNHNVFRKTEQLEEMIALSLVTAVGELAKSSTSVLDNLAISATQGEYDIEGKHAWVSGMGVCEAIIKSDDLRRIYAHKAAIYLINQMLNRSGDISEEVMNWIDNVQIREHDADQVIDELSKEGPFPWRAIDKADYSNALDKAQAYLLSQEPNIEEIDSRLQNLTARVLEELRLYVVRSLNRRQGCGIGDTEEILKTIESEVKIYLAEMKKEKTELSAPMGQYKSELESKCEGLATEAKGLTFYKEESLARDAKQIVKLVNQIALDKWDIVRRDKAIVFYNALLTRISEYKVRVTEIKQRVNNVANESRNQIASLRTHLKENDDARTFVYNLSNLAEGVATLDEEHILMADFLDGLKDGTKVYDFGEMETSTICQYILSYTYNINRAKEIGDMDINDVMNKMPSEEFDELVRKLVIKSSPLLLHNFRGYKNGKPAINYYLGVNDFEKSRLYKDNYFKNNIRDAADVNYARIGMKDRLIIFSQMSPIPPFAIDSIDECKNEYENPQQTICFHFDNTIMEQMKANRYSIFPGNTEASELELWVQGIIFGLIKNENGIYKAKDPNNDDLIFEDYWCELASDRDDAYRIFCEKIDIFGPVISEYVEKLRADEGEHSYKAKLKEANDPKKYLEIISQSGLTMAQLNDKANKSTKDCLVEEAKCIKGMNL